MPTPTPDPTAPLDHAAGWVLLLMRHAKAGSVDGPDHERPLAARGRRDAPVAGQWLAGQGLVPDLVVSSDAARARQTSDLVVEGLGADVPVRAADALYEASVTGVLAVVADVPDDVRTLLVVGHEPTTSATTATLTGDSPVFPTAAVAVVRLDGPWRDVEAGTGTMVAFWTPSG